MPGHDGTVSSSNSPDDAREKGTNGSVSTDVITPEQGGVTATSRIVTVALPRRGHNRSTRRLIALRLAGRFDPAGLSGRRDCAGEAEPLISPPLPVVRATAHGKSVHRET